MKEYIMESINGDAQYYGYRKITYHLRRTYNLIINCKKVYRLCKELNILIWQRKIHFKTKRILASNRTVTASNQVWEIDIKYGYVHGEINEFQTYAEAYKIVNTFMSFYNERRLHSSLKYMPPREFYTLYFGEHVEKICIKI
ncbi:IS3 family transposase [Clostridium septicum]|uniref:IS3 family transposase n=1 Tax=Clostridium septicum TaxID=1504 RepID=UPI002240B5FC|nr:IS3 family transposase [Clostridium septicum]WLF71087.1 IS3 family transposase [Clostridium septicum]